MGYEAYIFDPMDKISYKSLEWLSLPERHFKIAKTKEILNSNPEDHRLITMWLKTLPERFRNESLRYLLGGELFRVGHERERKFLLENNIKIAILHRHLKTYYEKIGFRNFIELETWIRSDVKYKGKNFKKPNSVGIQLEYRIDFIARLLSKVGIKMYDWSRYSQFIDENTIICNGKYGEVIEAMQKADFFIHNPRPSPQIKMFKGETFGLPLFEAMACGCVCIARKHDGIRFLEGNVPLVENMDDALKMLKYLMSNKEEKEEIRMRSIDFIEENYRFNRERKKAIERWLE